MLVLFETAAGYSLFKVTDSGALNDVDDLHKHFATADKASRVVKLKAFSQFDGTTEAVAAATALVEGSLHKGLKKFLSKYVVKKDLSDELAVADAKLGGLIKDKLGISCVNNSAVMELTRGIRSQMQALIPEISADSVKAIQLGLSHSLSRYKLKFSPDKVDTMIVQAVGLLDDLDKEINTYAMRAQEWYGWHFPEMKKVINDTIQYARCVRLMGMRTNCAATDFSSIVEDSVVEATLKDAAMTSMGTEISEGDLSNIQSLCEQVVNLSEYRVQLFDYLKNRMNAIAPNLTCMVGELVGARLIAHSGSLMNLAKHPASTVQILGAEKALFRSLKTKSNTPKYGLIYHASLVGQAPVKHKGKISRVLAAKSALAIRVDALGETEGPTIGLEARARVEARIRQLDGGARLELSSGATKASTGPSAYSSKAAVDAAPAAYNASSDVTDGSAKKKKRAREEEDGAENGTPKKKKDKKDKKDKKEKKEKKKKRKAED